ncbi:TniQ family protein [Cohnella sp. GCM10020058]|uniref:TniQ family protein n=1 Tax=Cohnella sp. GCM10020058 TaxID=3317330 RepID=UPI0036455E1B
MFNDKSRFEWLCQELNLGSPPKRNKFALLEPLGHGAFIESLTSYISRVSAYHQISTNNLILEGIHDQLEDSSVAVRNTWVSLYGRFVNGRSAIAQTAVDGLSKIISGLDLRRMTLLSWSHLIEQGQSRLKKAWCPLCFYEWDQLKTPLHEPLIWHFQMVEMCPIHNCLLVEECHSCGKVSMYLPATPQIGACPHCSHSLIQDPLTNTIKLPLDEWFIRRQKCIISNLGEMIEHSHKLENSVILSLTTVLDRIIDEQFAGNVAEFSREVKRPPHMFAAWRSGSNKPSLESWIWISTLFNTTMFKLVTGKKSKGLNLSANALFTKKKKRIMIKSKIIEVLEASLSEYPPKSLAQLAKRVPCYRIDSKRVPAELGNKVVTRYLQYRSEKKQQKNLGQTDD